MRVLIMILMGFSVLWGEHFWTNWRGNNRQDGLSPCIGPREPYFINKISVLPTCKKSTEIDNKTEKPNAIVPDVSAVISEDSTLYALHGVGNEKTYLLSIKNNNLQWREEFGDRYWGEQNICIDDEGILYFPYDRYYLIAYDGKQRYIIWQKGETDRGYSASTFVDKSIVYVITLEEYILAYNSKNGDLLWKEKLAYIVHPSYLFSYGDNGNMYFSNSFEFVEFKTDKTYKVLDADYASAPSIAKDGTLYSVFDKKLYAITPDMNIKWSSAAMEDTTEDFNPCAIDNAGNIICSSIRRNNIYKFSTNGTLLWKTDLVIYPSWITIDAENKIFVCSLEDHLYCLKPDGSLLYSVDQDDVNCYTIIGPSRRLYVFGYDYIWIYGGQEGFKERTETAKQVPAELDIYPNPFKDKLTINSTAAGAVYNLAGQTIHSFNKGKHILDTHIWEQGVYIIKSGSSTKRIIKIK